MLRKLCITDLLPVCYAGIANIKHILPSRIVCNTAYRLPLPTRVLVYWQHEHEHLLH